MAREEGMKTTCKFISALKPLRGVGCPWPSARPGNSRLSPRTAYLGTHRCLVFPKSQAVSGTARPSLRLGHTLATPTPSSQREGEPVTQRTLSRASRQKLVRSENNKGCFSLGGPTLSRATLLRRFIPIHTLPVPGNQYENQFIH